MFLSPRRLKSGGRLGVDLSRRGRKDVGFRLSRSSYEDMTGRDCMCRNIKTLFNFEPPATDDEIHASALQFVRKLSGFNKPSQANEAAFDRAVAEVSESARKLLTSL